MKSFLASVWKRRWCRVIGIFVVVSLLPLLHPFVRQSIFGPTIDGIPWCMWEEDIRQAAHPDRGNRSWFREMLAKLGYGERQHFGLDGNIAALPVYLHLADDRDVRVRRQALGQLSNWAAKYDESLEVMRRHLDDPDPHCRIYAAQVVWHVTKEPETIDIIQPLAKHADPEIRLSAVYLLCEMSIHEPALFETIAGFTKDGDLSVRINAVSTMPRFGKKAVPILERALKDENKVLRSTAINATARLKADAAPLHAQLQALQNDPEPNVRRNAAHALYMLDSKKYPKPSTWED